MDGKSNYPHSNLKVSQKNNLLKQIKKSQTITFILKKSLIIYFNYGKRTI